APGPPVHLAGGGVAGTLAELALSRPPPRRLRARRALRQRIASAGDREESAPARNGIRPRPPHRDPPRHAPREEPLGGGDPGRARPRAAGAALDHLASRGAPLV